MDLAHGFEIEDPAVVVPWNATEDEVRHLLSVITVTRGYLTADVMSLHGLRHGIGFHFYPRASGRLVELEFFRRNYPDSKASFEEFQHHLEATFGPPKETGEGDYAGLPWSRWSVGGAEIRHLVMDRFGPEEHVRITRS
jgi:hypothetical protein